MRTAAVLAQRVLGLQGAGVSQGGRGGGGEGWGGREGGGGARPASFPSALESISPALVTQTHQASAATA